MLAAFGLSFAQLELFVTVDAGTLGTVPGRARTAGLEKGTLEMWEKEGSGARW